MDRISASMQHSQIMSGKSGRALQFVYLKSVYIAAIASCSTRFSNLLLHETDIGI